MQFIRKCLTLRSSIMHSTLVSCFEHEIPIKQVIFGKINVKEVEDTLNLAGPAGDFNLEDEWERLMETPRMIEVSEGMMTPAPLVAFPRGVLDLEDFYLRLRKQPDNVTRIKKEITPNAAIKAELDAMGIEYKGNSSTESLKELLASVEDEDGSSDIQNEG
jgi:hypothetical protein